MAFGYTKTEFERKSTGERYRIERAELYFRKKAGATPFIFFAGALILGLYAYWGGGPLHYVSAALFASLGVWQFFYVNRAGVTAEEVDERARAMRGSLDPETDALNASDMDYDAFMDAPKIRLWGYTTLPIGEKKAVLRADRTDDTARSSHLQFTVFTLAEDTLETYSVIRSLLGDEKEETVMGWSYAQLKDAGFERLAADCAIEAGGEKTELRKFPVVSIRCNNKRMNRSYAICEDCRGDAEKLLRSIQKKQDTLEKGNEVS